MGKWKLGGEANSLPRNEDDVEGHSTLVKNDAAAAAADDVEGHWGAKNVDDQGTETDESSDKPGVRVRVRVRNDDDDVEGHKAGLRNDDDDVEGHKAGLRNDDDDVEGHKAGLRNDDDVEGHTLGAR